MKSGVESPQTFEQAHASFAVSGPSVAVVISPAAATEATVVCPISVSATACRGDQVGSLQVAIKPRAPADRRRLPCAHCGPPVFP